MTTTSEVSNAWSETNSLKTLGWFPPLKPHTVTQSVAKRRSILVTAFPVLLPVLIQEKECQRVLRHGLAALLPGTAVLSNMLRSLTGLRSLKHPLNVIPLANGKKRPSGKLLLWNCRSSCNTLFPSRRGQSLCDLAAKPATGSETA